MFITSYSSRPITDLKQKMTLTSALVTCKPLGTANTVGARYSDERYHMRYSPDRTVGRQIPSIPVTTPHHRVHCFACLQEIWGDRGWRSHVPSSSCHHTCRSSPCAYRANLMAAGASPTPGEHRSSASACGRGRRVMVTTRKHIIFLGVCIFLVTEKYNYTIFLGTETNEHNFN
jgi:hypothetical protein